MSFVKKIATVAFSALATFTLTTFVAAQDNNSSDNQTDKPMKERRWGRDGGGGKGMRGGRGGFGMRGFRELNLTDAQKEQIRGIMETAKTTNQPIFEELRTLKEKRRGGAELSATDIARVNEIKTQMKQSREQTENTILGILTAEQRQKFEQQKQERQQRRQEFRQRRQQNTPTTPEKNDGE